MEPDEEVPREPRKSRKARKARKPRTPGWKGRVTSGRDVDLEGLVTKRDLSEALQADFERIDSMSAAELRQALRDMNEDPGKLKLAGLRKKMKEHIMFINKEHAGAYGRTNKPLRNRPGKGTVSYTKADGKKVWVTKEQKEAWTAKKRGAAKRGPKVKVSTVDYVTNDGRVIQRSRAQVAFLEAQKARKGTGKGRVRKVRDYGHPSGSGDKGAFDFWSDIVPGSRSRVPWKHFYGERYSGLSKAERASFAAKKRREFKAKFAGKEYKPRKPKA